MFPGAVVGRLSRIEDAQRMEVEMIATVRPAAAAAVLVAALAACGAVGGTPQANHASATPSYGTTVQPGGLPRNTPPPAAHIVVARDQDNGHTVTLRV